MDRDGAAAPALDSSQAGFGQMIQQFEALLGEEAGLDTQSRELLVQQYRQALEDAAPENAPGASIPDRGVWMDAVQALQEGGAVAEDEANDLVRHLDRALEPLQRRESQLAIEFTRRMQTDGEAQALAWFREQSAKAADARQDAELATHPTPPAAVASLDSEVVNSRSRRLRGPPRQR